MPERAPHPAQRLGIDDFDAELTGMLSGQAQNPIGEPLPLGAPVGRVGVQIVLVHLSPYARAIDEHLAMRAMLHRAEHVGYNFDFEHNRTESKRVEIRE